MVPCTAMDGAWLSQSSLSMVSGSGAENRQGRLAIAGPFCLKDYFTNSGKSGHSPSERWPKIILPILAVARLFPITQHAFPLLKNVHKSAACPC